MIILYKQIVKMRYLTLFYSGIVEITYLTLFTNCCFCSIDGTFFQGIRPVRCVIYVPGQLVTHVVGSYPAWPDYVRNSKPRRTPRQDSGLVLNCLAVTC